MENTNVVTEQPSTLVQHKDITGVPVPDSELSSQSHATPSFDPSSTITVRTTFGPYTITSTDLPGQPVFSLPISLALHAILRSNGDVFARYRFISLLATLANANAANASSGVVITAYNPDPINVLSEVDYDKNLHKMVRLPDSKRTKPLENTEFRFDKEDFQNTLWTVNDGNLRLESHGRFESIVYASPTDVTSTLNFNVIITASVLFTMPSSITRDVVASFNIIPGSVEVLDNTRFTQVKFAIQDSDRIPPGVSMMSLDGPIEYTFGQLRRRNKVVSKIGLYKVGNMVHGYFLTRVQNDTAQNLRVMNKTISGEISYV